MNHQHDFGFDPKQLEELSRLLEAGIEKLNSGLLSAVGITAEEVVSSLIEVQTQLLKFDQHEAKNFKEAVENARVKTLSQGNLFMACILCSALALSAFKNQPQPASITKQKLRFMRNLRQHSTSGPALFAFAWASFYALLGSKAWKRLQDRARSRPFKIS